MHLAVGAPDVEVARAVIDRSRHRRRPRQRRRPAISRRTGQEILTVEFHRVHRRVPTEDDLVRRPHAGGDPAERPRHALDRAGPAAGRVTGERAVADLDRLQRPRIGPHVDEGPVGVRDRGAVDVVEGPGRGATGERTSRRVELPHARLADASRRPARHPDDVVGVIHVGRRRDDVHVAWSERPNDRAPAGCRRGAVQGVDLVVDRVAGVTGAHEDHIAGHSAGERQWLERLNPDPRPALEGGPKRRALPHLGAGGRVHRVEESILRADVGDIHPAPGWSAVTGGKDRRARLDRSTGGERREARRPRAVRVGHAMEVVVVRARDHDVAPRVKTGRGHTGRGRRVAPLGGDGGGWGGIDCDAGRVATRRVREDLVVVGGRIGEGRLEELRR